MGRTSRLRCSPRANPLYLPSLVHRYILTFFCTPPCMMNTGAVGTLRPRDFLVRFGTGTGAPRRESPEARAVAVPFPPPMLTFTPPAPARRERLRERDTAVRLCTKSVSSSPSAPSERSATSLSPESLHRSSSDSPVRPGGLDDPGAA